MYLTAVACYGLLNKAAADSIVVGDVRISALSPTLVRIEPKGPKGFEDRSTFNVVGRGSFNASGLAISVLRNTTNGTWLATSAYHVFLPAEVHPEPLSCNPQEGTDAVHPTRVPAFPDGAQAKSLQACCALCSESPDCVAYTYKPNASTSHKAAKNCWPFSAVGSTTAAQGRVYGSVRLNPLQGVYVTAPAGQVLWSASAATPVQQNLLHWPSPMSADAYAFSDRPRFTVPAWGPTPVPQGTVVPPDTAHTNGYDFNNDVDGDTYVFLLGDDLGDWWASRGEFLSLTGPTPLLPDFAFGIWYTWYAAWHVVCMPWGPAALWPCAVPPAAPAAPAAPLAQVHQLHGDTGKA